MRYLLLLVPRALLAYHGIEPIPQPLHHFGIPKPANKIFASILPIFVSIGFSKFDRLLAKFGQLYEICLVGRSKQIGCPYLPLLVIIEFVPELGDLLVSLVYLGV